MEAKLHDRMNAFTTKHRNYHRWQRVLSVLMTAVVFCTTYALVLPAITMERETYCGLEEHVHDESCYEQRPVLVCALPETEGHVHDESCWGEEPTLSCGLEETEGHAHSADCYEPRSFLMCGRAEDEGHTYEAYQVFSGKLEDGKLTDIVWGSGVDSEGLLTDLTKLDDFKDCKTAEDVAEVLKNYENDSAALDAFADIVGAHLNDANKKSSSDNKITDVTEGYCFIKDKDTTKTYKLVTTDNETSVETEKDNKITVTVENGVLRLGELGEGDCILHETKAPEGYNTLKSDITVHIAFDAANKQFTATAKLGAEDAQNLTFNAENKEFELKIENNSGTELPSTGGMGTTIFYVAGSLMVLFAGVMLITHKRLACEK